MIAVLDDVGERVAHDVDRPSTSSWQDELVVPRMVGVAHGAAQDPAQHVAAALVAEGNTPSVTSMVRAGVLGEHAIGEVSRSS